MSQNMFAIIRYVYGVVNVSVYIFVTIFLIQTPGTPGYFRTLAFCQWISSKRQKRKLI